MTGRPGHHTMEMNGRSTVSYLVRTPRVPFFTLILIGLEREGLLAFQWRHGIASVVRWNLRPVIFGAEISFREETKGPDLFSRVLSSLLPPLLATPLPPRFLRPVLPLEKHSVNSYVEQRAQHRAWRGAVSRWTSPESPGKKFLPEICVKKGQGRFCKRAVLANVPSFRFLVPGNIRMYPRSGWSRGTSERTLVPVFGTGEHPPKPPFWKPPNCEPPILGKYAFFGGGWVYV